MKTNIIANNTVINAIMKKYIKYLCAVLMIIGTSVHAWGATCTLYGGLNGNTTITTIDASSGVLPSTAPAVAGWEFLGCWTTTKYSASSPTTNYPSGSFVKWNGSNPGGETKLYAVYYRSCENNYYSGAPFVCYDISSLSPASGDSYAWADKYCNIVPGTSVTITAVPDDGKVVTEWTILDGNADYITPTSTTATTFTFTMPSSDVEAEVSFGDPCTARTLTFANSTVSKSYGTAAAKYQNYSLSAGGGTVTWGSSNTDVASVSSSTGVITINKAGSTTISVQVDADATYCAREASYTLNVTAVAPTLSHNTAGKALTVSSITSTGATFSGGVVTAKGGSNITRYGYVIGTSSTVVVGGTGANAPVAGSYFNSDIALNTAFGSKTATTSFTPNTTYYVRAFAYNGTSYGHSTAVSFTTLQRYAVTYYKNDGSGTSAVEYKDHGVSYTVSSDKFSRDGYNLSKWHTLAAGTGGTDYAKNASYATNAALDLYAVWTPATYTVTFNKNGGSGGSDNVTATYNATMPDATMPTTPPTNKTFDGYYYGGTKYYNADGSSAHVWDIAGEATLTASWVTATPTLKMGSSSKVTISATTPSVAAGGSTTVTAGSTVSLSYSGVASGYAWAGWNVYETGNSANTVTVTNNQFTMPAYNVTVDAKVMSDYVFSCATLSLTGPSGDVVYITSTADKTVRSQEAFHVTGTGLTASTALDFSFGNDALNDVFEFKLADGTAPTTNSSGAIDADIYVYYTPSETTDGLDKATNLTVSMAGGKPKQATLNTKTIVGRHLPADFVIAAKSNGKWYALPSNMTTGTPAIVEIAVDNADNPTVAYTANTNFYSIAQPDGATEKQYVRLKMQGQSNAPLFGSSGTGIGKSSTLDADKDDIGNGYLWMPVQKNTDASVLTNAENAVYHLYNKNKNDSLRIKTGTWGLYSYASTVVQDIRLIPASTATVVEAEIVEWGVNGVVVEVDAAAISATKVLARLNGAASTMKTLSQTLTSGKSRTTAYNYTVDFGTGINFTSNANCGKVLMLEWYNSTNSLVGVTSIIVPKVIASTTTMSGIDVSGGSGNKGYWKDLEVHVLPGAKLTVNTGSFSNAVTIRELQIYPGATVSVTPAGTAGTLTVDTLILRNGWTRVGEKSYDVARLYLQPYIDASHKAASLVHTKAYLDWYIDYDQYYPIGLPWPVTTSAITYKNSNTAASAGVKIRYYDGSKRAESGKTGQSWIEYTWGGTMPSTLAPSTGYALTAKRPSGKAFAIVRMPLTFTDAWTTAGEQGNVSTHKDQVSVSANSGSLAWYTQGWNFVANPYMYDFSGNTDGVKNNLVDQSGTNYRYATIPDVDFQNFDQVNITSATLAPASGFFVQVASNTTLTFSKSGIVTPSAPARYTNEPEAVPDQEAYILLSNETGEKDQMGLIIGWDYTAEYEINADLAKILAGGNALKTYMQYGGTEMAYVAINEVLAREWIPVTVYIPAAGEYTYSLQNSSTVDELEGLYLIDYLTGTTTNLLFDEYTFTAEEGTLGERFAINAIVGDHKVPTGADVTGLDKDSNGPIKFIWHDKVFILHGNVIYDSTGKRVSVINK